MESFLEFCLRKVAKKHNVDLKGIDMGQLKMGMSTEREHDEDKDTDVVPGHDEGTVMKIAVAHLREKPDYYSVLKKAKL